MQKLLTAASAIAMVFSATAAQAATRPETTRLAPPVAQANSLANEDGEFAEVPFELIALGLGGLLAVLLFAASGNGNSPR
jgi:hypothetical protein